MIHSYSIYYFTIILLTILKFTITTSSLQKKTKACRLHAIILYPTRQSSIPHHQNNTVSCLFVMGLQSSLYRHRSIADFFCQAVAHLYPALTARVLTRFGITTACSTSCSTQFMLDMLATCHDG